MPVESANNISELISTNPVGDEDDVSEGDDHLRLLKTVLLNDFPNINRAVTATPEQLNTLDGFTGTTANLNILSGRKLASSDDVIDNFPALTRMLFQQTESPTGWTKDSSNTNERALRVVSGTAGSGGDTNFTTVFSATRATDSEAGHTHGTSALLTSAPSATVAGGGGGSSASPTHIHTVSGSTDANSSHSHTSDLNVYYLDVIIAHKL
jgi:hypothetical protein